MIYVFEKTLSTNWSVRIEADSFEEAKEILENENPIWDADDGGESYLESSRCLQFENEDNYDNFDFEELEWEP